MVSGPIHLIVSSDLIVFTLIGVWMTLVAASFGFLLDTCALLLGSTPRERTCCLSQEQNNSQ